VATSVWAKESHDTFKGPMADAPPPTQSSLDHATHSSVRCSVNNRRGNDDGIGLFEGLVSERWLCVSVVKEPLFFMLESNFTFTQFTGGRKHKVFFPELAAALCWADRGNAQSDYQTQLLQYLREIQIQNDLSILK